MLSNRHVPVIRLAIADDLGSDRLSQFLGKSRVKQGNNFRYICTAKVDRGEHREGHVDHFGKQVGSPGDVNECKFFIDNPVDIKAFDEESVNMLLDADLGQRWCKPGLVIMHLYIAKQVIIKW